MSAARSRTFIYDYLGVKIEGCVVVMQIEIAPVGSTFDLLKLKINMRDYVVARALCR